MGGRQLLRTGIGVIVALFVAYPAGAQEASEPTRPRLVFYGLKALTEVTPGEAEALGRMCEAQLGEHYDVIGPRDISTLLDHEAQKQLMGCSDDASCLTEIGGALGAGRVVYGDLARLGDTVLISLALMEVDDSRVLKRATRKVENAQTLAPVVDVLGAAVSEIIAADPLFAGQAIEVKDVKTVEVIAAPRVDKRFQLRLMARADGALTMHSALRSTETTVDEPSREYDGGGGSPTLGIGVRMGRHDFLVAVGATRWLWAAEPEEYDLVIPLVTFRLDWAYAISVFRSQTRLTLGLGYVQGLGPGGHVMFTGEHPIAQGSNWGLDVFGALDLEYHEAPNDGGWDVSGVAGMASVGLALRIRP